MVISFNKSNEKNNSNRSQNPSIEKLLFYKNKSTPLTDYCITLLRSHFVTSAIILRSWVLTNSEMLNISLHVFCILCVPHNVLSRISLRPYTVQLKKNHRTLPETLLKIFLNKKDEGSNCLFVISREYLIHN